MSKPRTQRKQSAGGKWSEEEDNRLKAIIQEYGSKNWKMISQLLGTTRTDCQCLHRWNKVLKVIHNSLNYYNFAYIDNVNINVNVSLQMQQ